MAELRGERSGFFDEDLQNLCGYVENISEGGMGVTSWDTLLLGIKVKATIGPVEKDIISPSASLAFTRIDGYLYYYGFQFMLITQDEHQCLKQVIWSLMNARV